MLRLLPLRLLLFVPLFISSKPTALPVLSPRAFLLPSPDSTYSTTLVSNSPLAPSSAHRFLLLPTPVPPTTLIPASLLAPLSTLHNTHLPPLASSLPTFPVVHFAAAPSCL